MLTGAPHFGGSVSDVMDQHIKNEPKPIDSIVRGVSPKMLAIVDRLMRKKPAERYQLFPDLLRDLDEVRHEEKGQLPATGLPSSSVAGILRDRLGGESRQPDNHLQDSVRKLRIWLAALGVGLAAALAAVAYLLLAAG